MSNSNQEVNVTVSTPDELHDAKVKAWREQEREVIDELRKHIFFVKSQGNQRYYYDAKSGANSLTVQHLIGIVSHEMKKFDSEWVMDPTSSKDPVRARLQNTHFNSIVMQPQYRPNQEVATYEDGLYFPNVWRKPDVVPTEYTSVAKARSKNKGAAPFIEHLQLMLGDTTKDLDDPESKAGYLLRMLAFRYQTHDFRETEKPHVAFYFYGKQGMGKGIFGRTLEAVFGKTAVMTVPDEKSLTSMSAVDVFSRTWAIVDEVNILKGSTNYNTIKTHTGSTQTTSARKNEHFRGWYIPAQLIMFSQKPPTFIEAGDRRFFISHWETEFESTEAKDDYFRDYTNWLHDKGGFGAIAGLLKVTDVSKLRTESAAMVTHEKLQVVAMVTDDSVQEMTEVLDENPERICWTEDDFLETFLAQEVSQKQYGYKMEEAGLVEQLKRKYGGSRSIKFYLRKGWEIRVVNGKGSWLQSTSDSNSKMKLKEDAGYLAAMARDSRSRPTYEDEF
jgi:hypothetical protein